jgi:hypothetical protein
VVNGEGGVGGIDMGVMTGVAGDADESSSVAGVDVGVAGVTGDADESSDVGEVIGLNK